MKSMVNILTIFVLIDTITWTLGVPLRRQSKSSLVDWTNYNAYEPEGRGTYAFGYDVEDPETNNIQFRDEERHPNGTITGSYGYLRPDGMVHIAHYVADDKGYR
ncbi:hypothetical protein NQ314_000390 [Rhamnusium bicolor]|uniref:Uncharacterized protein n=1 Tax=Rhamnusium bicolor TaxID=1586634 RepID=A0AAV8ZUR8_9CUCU|nr:hypothetical protein NQ314_000390 [Rhamnusium bicolor]